MLQVQVKLHPWFAGLDWASLARQKAAFVPTLEHEFDTSYFASKPVRFSHSQLPVALCRHKCVPLYPVLHRAALPKSL